ncbi:MAG: DUF4332 domain-containing protein [Candidatus Sericytochromatia bacterium]
MLSKCPECGRSYPAHHGDICKMCAAKKNKAAEPEKKSANTSTSTTGAKSASANQEEEGSIFFKEQPQQKQEEKSDFMDMSMISASGAFKEDAIKKLAEKNNVFDVCPNCQAPNASVALFCVECGKMLTISAGEQKVMDYKLTDVRGITKEQLEILKKEGIDTTLKLLDKAYSPTKRKTLTLKTNLNEVLLYRLVNQCDLLRLDGVEPLNAYLLELIGMSTVKHLERRTSKDILNLIKEKKSVLFSKQVIIIPEEKLVNRWIDDAKKIQKVVS